MLVVSERGRELSGVPCMMSAFGMWPGIFYFLIVILTWESRVRSNNAFSFVGLLGVE